MARTLAKLYVVETVEGELAEQVDHALDQFLKWLLLICHWTPKIGFCFIR